MPSTALGRFRICCEQWYWRLADLDGAVAHREHQSLHARMHTELGEDIHHVDALRPTKGSFDPAAAARGKILFDGQARCASCHAPPLFTEPGWNLHTPAEIGIDSFQADRSPTHNYRTAPLRGLWTHRKGGFYHD